MVSFDAARADLNGVAELNFALEALVQTVNGATNGEEVIEFAPLEDFSLDTT